MIFSTAGIYIAQIGFADMIETKEKENYGKPICCSNNGRNWLFTATVNGTLRKCYIFTLEREGFTLAKEINFVDYISNFLVYDAQHEGNVERRDRIQQVMNIDSAFKTYMSHPEMVYNFCVSDQLDVTIQVTKRTKSKRME